MPQQKKHFLWKVHLDKTTLTRNNWENRVLKVSPTEYCYIYYVYNTDWLCAPFFLNYFESEWFYRDEPFIKNVSFGGARKKCYIFKIGEPFKGIVNQFWVYNIFVVSQRKKHFYERSISIKQLWLEIIEKRGCTKSVRPSTVIYIIYITRTDFVHPFFSIISSQSGFIEMNLL